MVRERRRLSPLAWDAASLLLGHPYCINPFEVRDCGEPGREETLREAKASDLSGTTRGTRPLCFQHLPAGWIKPELYW